MDKKIILGCLISGLVIGLVLFKEKSQEENNFFVNEVNQNSNNLMALFIEDDNGVYNKTNKIPGEGYQLNEEKSVCSNGSKPVWVNNELRVSGITSSGVGCYLYFEKNSITIPEMVASHNPIAGPTEFTGISGSDESALLSGEDDDGTTYYFRGNVTDNWVYFAENYWRIIRVNGDGSMRIIYDYSVNKGFEVVSVFNKNYNSAEFVGLQYSSGLISGNNINSTILGEENSNSLNSLYGWYNSKIRNTQYEKFIDSEVGFCSDRKVANNSFSSNVSDYLIFSPSDRIFTSNMNDWRKIVKPTFKCNNNTDILKVPIGLITADEVIFAGGFGNKKNSSYYLDTSRNYWTMSPSHTPDAVLYCVDGGALNIKHAGDKLHIRPVLNLKSSIGLVGSGTASDPYKVV